jgi:hypothetical protein
MGVKGDQADAQIRGAAGSNRPRVAIEDNSGLGERRGLTDGHFERPAVVENELDYDSDHEDEQGHVKQPARPESRSVPPADVALSSKSLFVQEFPERMASVSPKLKVCCRNLPLPDGEDFPGTKPGAAQRAQEEQ